MTPTDASERERLAKAVEELLGPSSFPLITQIAAEAAAMLRADAEKIRALEADAARYRYLRTCDRNPNEPHIVYFDGEEWRIFIEVADEMIDAALAATQSPRSEAVEDVK